MSQSYVHAGRESPGPLRGQVERRQKLRVLVADTDAAARRVCAGYCDLFDFDCAIAASRRDAAALIERERFDVADSSFMTGASLVVDGGITAAYVTPE